MDIKDFILIGGGLLIAAVVAHGFWIAWRERRRDLRIDIKPDLIPDKVDEIDRLRGELPNGGGRLVQPDYHDPEQDTLDLKELPPLLLEPSEGPPAKRIEPGMSEVSGISAAGPTAVEASIDASQRRHAPVVERIDDTDYALPEEPDPGRVTGQEAPMARQRGGEARQQHADRARVADVALPDPIVPDEPKRPRRLGQRRNMEQSKSASHTRREAQRPAGDDLPSEAAELATAAPVEELVVINILADAASPYTGDELFTALRTCGLKFGDMNIFHRIEPLTKAVQYSVASAVEPGTFDMADMEAIRCQGLCLFMQLPGPENPTAAFEDMLSVARSVTKSLAGEVRDEHRNLMTPQTVEHYRQRIVDFSRRRMSKRA